MVLLTSRGAIAQENNEILKFDFPALSIGVAERDDGPTGTTVFYFPDGVTAAADVRGGSPGTLNVPAVNLGYEDPFLNAIVFSGGSAFGLSAATGAMNEIGTIKRSKGDYDFIPGVLGAIIYDVGGRRFSRKTSYSELGAEALRDAVPNEFPLGARGAGRFAMQGVYFHKGSSKESFANWAHSGQGGAFRQVGETKIAVFTIVNSMGTIVDRDGMVVRCHRNDPAKSCPMIKDLMSDEVEDRQNAIRSFKSDSNAVMTSNTTLTLVVTNEKLDYASLKRLAMQVHTSMGRAIQPFSTSADGDVLFAVTTNELENEKIGRADLEVIASEVAWDAVLNSVPSLPELTIPSEQPPEANTLLAYVGEYLFPGESKVEIVKVKDTLSLKYKGRNSIYFSDEGYELLFVKPDLFILDSPAKDVIKFQKDKSGAQTLVLNPGPWALFATKNR